MRYIRTCQKCGLTENISKTHFYCIKKGIRKNICNSCSQKGRKILWRDKIKKTLKGRHCSPKTEFKKGFKPSKKHRENLSNALKGKLAGKKHWNYIDGRSKLVGPGRYGDDWDKIRYLVYLRDHFTCQECGIKGIRLDIHHIVPFLISFDNSLNNLITLCRSCHMKIEHQLNLRRKHNDKIHI